MGVFDKVGRTCLSELTDKVGVKISLRRDLFLLLQDVAKETGADLNQIFCVIIRASVFQLTNVSISYEEAIELAARQHLLPGQVKRFLERLGIK